MKKEIQHAFVVETSKDQAWAFLLDIGAVAKCIPGCTEVLVQDPGKSYKARMRRNVGPFLIRFELDISVDENVPSERLQVVVSGEDKRLRSQIQQNVAVSLTDLNPGQCQIEIATNFQLSGMLASLGDRLLEGQIQQELDTFVGCVRNALLERASMATV